MTFLLNPFSHLTSTMGKYLDSLLRIKQSLCTFISVLVMFGSFPNAVAMQYGEALQKSLLFYETQQSGYLPEWNRVQWRGNSTTLDGKKEGVDLSGGWYDAGDHVKFGLPMAASVTLLAWGAVDYPRAYKKSRQDKHLLNNLRYAGDYLLNAHVSPNRLYGQVGLGADDHSWWGPAEVLMQSDSDAAKRKAYFISENCRGSDLAGETAAAMASLSLVFKRDLEYRKKLLTHAEQLYEFAVRYQGIYSDCLADAEDFYPSSGYEDELVWAAAWLFKATGEARYLREAEARYQSIGKIDYAPTSANVGNKTKPDQPNEPGTVLPFNWTHSWDQKIYGSYVLLAQLTGKQRYEQDAERWLDYWTTGINGHRVPSTRGGFAHLSEWGSARYAANTAWLALVYKDYLKKKAEDKPRQLSYGKFAKRQIDYLLGKNPNQFSYLIGFGKEYPLLPHHRTAHGSWTNNIDRPKKNRHLLMGALVGGPDRQDNHNDDRDDHKSNEVALDYNAGFTSALARLYLEFGGDPLPDGEFPVAERVIREFPVKAQLYSSGPSHLELGVQIENNSAWPARNLKDFTIRYWLQLSPKELAGRSPKEMLVNLSSDYSRANGLNGKELVAWDKALGLWYADFDVYNANLAPVGAGREKAVLHLRMELDGGRLDPANDPSWSNFNDRMRPANGIGIYVNRQLVAGVEPNRSRNANRIAEDTGGISGFDCKIQDVDKWKNGLVMNSVLVTNRGTSKQRWMAVIPAKGIEQIEQAWNAQVDWNGAHVQAIGDWLEPGETASFGFKASHSGRFRYEKCQAVLYSGPAPLTGRSLTSTSGTGDGSNKASIDAGSMPSTSCLADVTSDWGNGFIASLNISNPSKDPIKDWEIYWTLPLETRIDKHWNFNIQEKVINGQRLFTATPLHWNQEIAPQSSIDLGFQVSKRSSEMATPAIRLTGGPCR